MFSVYVLKVIASVTLESRLNDVIQRSIKLGVCGFVVVRVQMVSNVAQISVVMVLLNSVCMR